MRFLLDANMPRSALALLVQHGHEAEHVKDIGLGDAPDSEIQRGADKCGGRAGGREFRGGASDVDIHVRGTTCRALPRHRATHTPRPTLILPPRRIESSKPGQ
jgi:hypothetical protein